MLLPPLPPTPRYYPLAQAPPVLRDGTTATSTHGGPTTRVPRTTTTSTTTLDSIASNGLATATWLAERAGTLALGEGTSKSPNLVYQFIDHDLQSSTE